MISVHRDYLMVYQDMGEEDRAIQQQFAELDELDGKGSRSRKGKGKGAKSGKENSNVWRQESSNGWENDTGWSNDGGGRSGGSRAVDTNSWWNSEWEGHGNYQEWN